MRTFTTAELQGEYSPGESPDRGMLADLLSRMEDERTRELEPLVQSEASAREALRTADESVRQATRARREARGAWDNAREALDSARERCETRLRDVRTTLLRTASPAIDEYLGELRAGFESARTSTGDYLGIAYRHVTIDGQTALTRAFIAAIEQAERLKLDPRSDDVGARVATARADLAVALRAIAHDFTLSAQAKRSREATVRRPRPRRSRRGE